MMQIGEVGKQTSLTVDAIRFYEKRKLLPKPGSGIRRTRLSMPEHLVFAAYMYLRWFCLTILASGVRCCSPSRSYLVTLNGLPSTGVS
jgi:hypothetical protein